MHHPQDNNGEYCDGCDARAVVKRRRLHSSSSTVAFPTTTATANSISANVGGDLSALLRSSFPEQAGDIWPSTAAAADSDACYAALLEGPAACRAALSKYQAYIDSALAKTLEAVGCYEHKVLAPPCSSPHLELGSLLSGFLCSLRVSDYFLFLCTYLQDGRSSLHESVARGDEATAQVLIAAGADMVAKDEVKESS